MPDTMWVDALALGVLGLVIGSFLNVVIFRLPKMMDRQWKQECAELSGAPMTEEPVFNLMVPRSRCPHCNHQIRWYENVPVLSYAVLGGKCSSCKTPISLRYPSVELATGVFFGLVGWRYGLSVSGACWAAFVAGLLALFWIDFDTQLLPDDITYPFLWLGLIASAIGVIAVPLKSAVLGATFGYLALWVVYHVHHFVTGKEGFGYGDFKLLAGLGAWFGHEHLIPIILMSSIVGALVGGLLLLVGKLANKDVHIPYGPFLAGAGLVLLACGPQQVRNWLPFAYAL
ncbi:MAG: hypothetical protein RLZZ126_1355 [Pseudomonadota bacterium]|jgi:leader peptidase (prepilin peptidase) / N-methyltransferase